MFHALVPLIAMVAPVEAAPVVAVAELQNQTADPSLDPLAAGAADLLLGRLQRSGAVTVVERDALDAIVAELELGVSGWADPKTVAETGRLVGARFLVTGGVISAGLPHLAVTVRVVDTQTAEVVVTREVSSVVESGDDFLALMDDVAAQTLEALDLELADGTRLAWDADRERERAALDRWGVRFSAVAMNHPEALYRDRSRDQMDDVLRQWSVYDNQGKEVAMPLFSRRVGDDAGAKAYVDAYVASTRVRRNRLLLASSFIVLPSAALIARGAITEEPAPNAVGIPVSLAVMGGVCGLLGAPVGHMIRMHRYGYPSSFYTPQEADEWIDRYNASLR